MAEPYACQGVTYFSVASNGEGDPPEARFECDGGPTGNCGWSVDVDGLPVGLDSITWQDMERRHAAHSISVAVKRGITGRDYAKQRGARLLEGEPSC